MYIVASWLAVLIVMPPAVLSNGRLIHAQEPVDHVDPEADRILREMGEYLAAAEAFTVQADVTTDSVLRSGQWVTVGARSQIATHRPDKVRVEYHGDERQRRVVLNDGRFTMYDAEKNVYAVADVPTRIDDAIDHVVDTFGFSVSLSDLLSADPYETLIANVESGFVVGLHAVDGVRCHHLAFSQEWIDWEVWIEDGPRPVPRQVVITYKDEEGAPGYAVRLSNWDFRPGFSDHYFEFQPPPGSDSIEFLPTQEEIQP
jgi:hypothetical protein